ncbi:hypothetical protein Isop_2209 [Isosphaera pallida ATCC 43644]|uniref:Uncharacterized protein n=1 Tax=Isosphaera pallida (strain ATCC 43644 / DSM 9630 / IS1B) TaxID=575540 RepID=E8R530_ISOPI|nr:hypothetical protein [Isosphaera pallida]ADV62787.1 hypothetical protein Isop_2209 [Isosphaera pallida ATCC 43644]
MVTTLMVMVSILPGCGGSTEAEIDLQTSPEAVGLTELGEVLRLYQIQFKKPPAKVADLAPLEQMAGMVMDTIRNKTIEVIWGVDLPDLGEQPGLVESKEILAYEAKAPTEGGYVLFRDRTVKKLTAEEFNATPKAAPDHSSKD